MSPVVEAKRLLPGLSAPGFVLLLLVAVGQDGFLEEEVKLGGGGCGNTRVEKVAKIRLGRICPSSCCVQKSREEARPAKRLLPCLQQGALAEGGNFCMQAICKAEIVGGWENRQGL